jgi:4-carboxymuconolactone decarboxylase
MAMSDDYERGMAVRRKVVGEAYVDASIRTDPFNAPFQQIICEKVWGTYWTREGLPLRDRSLIVVAFLIAQGRSGELGLHLRGAITNGCTLEELRETIIQSIGYCGAPAAVEAMKVANTVLADLIAAMPERA